MLDDPLDQSDEPMVATRAPLLGRPREFPHTWISVSWAEGGLEESGIVFSSPSRGMPDTINATLTWVWRGRMGRIVSRIQNRAGTQVHSIGGNVRREVGEQPVGGFRIDIRSLRYGPCAAGLCCGLSPP